jgi:hypothetical protein
MDITSSGRHRKKNGSFDQLLPPRFTDTLLSSVPLLPDTWGRITSNRTHRVSRHSIEFLARKHDLPAATIRKMLERLP